MSTRIPKSPRPFVPAHQALSRTAPTHLSRDGTPPLDMLVIGMERDESTSLSLQGALKATRLQHQTIYCETLPGDSAERRGPALLSLLREMLNDGRLGSSSHVLIHLHGSPENNTLIGGTIEGAFSIDLRALIRELTAGLSAVGVVHVATCHSLYLAPWLAQRSGTAFLLYAGRHSVLSYDLIGTVSAVIGKIDHIRARRAPIDARTLWEHAATVTGEKLTLISQGDVVIHRPLKSPAVPLPLSARQRTLHVLAKLDHGKAEAFAQALALLTAESFALLQSYHPLHLLVTLPLPDIEVVTDCREKALLLLAIGIDVHDRDNDGRTPLHLACEHNHTTMIRCLLANGANRGVRNGAGHNAAEIARYSGADRAQRLLLQHASGETFINDHVSRFFLQCVRRQRIAAIDLMLRPHIASALTDDEGNRLIHLAVARTELTALLLLTEAGVALDVPNRQGDLPLHLAVMRDSDLMLTMLIHAGAPVDARSDNGDTALHLAARSGRTACVQALLHHGAHPGLQNQAGLLPADEARAGMHLSALDLLRAAANRQQEPLS